MDIKFTKFANKISLVCRIPYKQNITRSNTTNVPLKVLYINKYMLLTDRAEL